MKKTNEELLQFFGLKIGDKIKVDGYYWALLLLNEKKMAKYNILKKI